MDGTTIKDGKEKREKPVIVKNYTDLQRLKLEKLMKNPDKPVLIPEQPKRKGVPTIPDFVRNVMGSSAGAGSGEFHVYRHLRRKEYARQKYMKEKGEKERLDDEYHNKIESNKLIADSKTAKKRQKRLKRNQRKKNNPKKPKIEDNESENESSDESEAEENPCLESKGSSTEDVSQTESTDIVDISEKEELTCMQEEPEVPLEADKNLVKLGSGTDERETDCSQGKLDQSKVLRQEEENSGEIVPN